MFKIKLVALSILLSLTCYSQTKEDSLLAKNKQTIARLKNRITTIENIGTDNSSTVNEIAQLRATIKKQNDSIIVLNKIIHTNLVATYLSDCHCFRLFFNSSQTRVDYNQFPELDSLARIVKANPNQKLKLSGHADKTGAEINNIVFSKTRVENLKRYLIEQKKVPASAIAIEWHGSTIPSKDAADDDKQFLNRRVEVLVEGKN